MQARCLVGFLAVSNTFNHVDELCLTGNLADNNGVERVPFADYIAFLDCCSVAEVKFRTIRDVGVCQHHARIGVDDTHFCQTAYNYVAVLCLNRAELFNLKHTVVA